MGRIRVLPDSVVNKIAAGEVVERPASVAKELVENAIDAGATEIRIEVRKGGASLVRVRDNGCGMSREEALLALERHSTSKIASADDLFNIRTMGFRGEALPSIAAVSRMSLSTKERGALAGTRIIVEGGRVGETRETGAPEGTEIAVRELFFNTPVRRKFLRTDRAEAGLIAAIVLREALARPDIGFTLVSGEEELIKAPAASSFTDRVAALFGAELARELIPFEGREGSAAVRGYISAPAATRGNRSAQYFFVNNRPVEDRMLGFAVSDACEGVVPAKRYPVVFLFLEVATAEVDVNVHPAKREVRFRSGGRVRELVRGAVSGAIRASGIPAAAEGGGRYETRVEGRVIDRIPPARPLEIPLPWKEGGAPASPGVGRRLQGEQAPAAERAARGLHPLGQIGNLYVLCEEPGVGLAIIDQHAAHERVLFERVMGLHEGGAGGVQRLLIPAVVNLTAPEYALAADYLETLKGLGMGIEPFGANALKIDALPACLGAIDAGGLVKDVLGELAEEGRGRAVRDRMAERAAMKVCRAAVKRRDPLRGEELRRLVDDLMRCATPHTCPHGRPTIIRMSMAELAKKFGRA